MSYQIVKGEIKRGYDLASRGTRVCDGTSEILRSLFCRAGARPRTPPGSLGPTTGITRSSADRGTSSPRGTPEVEGPRRIAGRRPLQKLSVTSASPAQRESNPKSLDSPRWILPLRCRRQGAERERERERERDREIESERVRTRESGRVRGQKFGKATTRESGIVRWRKGFE